MDEYISFDSHRRYTLAEREQVASGRAVQQRIEHRPGAIRGYLAQCQPGTAVAVEATGNWYWIVQEIEQAGMVPKLVHPRKAKVMMGMINKTDKLDVHGLNRLQRNKTLPDVWIPPAGLRDLRELTRTRMVFVAQRTRLKNRLTSTLAKYGLAVEGASDPFGQSGRQQWPGLLGRLPEHTHWVSQRVVDQLDFVDRQIEQLEDRLAGALTATAEMELQRSVPGFGPILSAVVVLELGAAARFAGAEKFASYAGTTPRVVSSGGKTRYGRLRPDVNRYLRWAFVEAANTVALWHQRRPGRHVSQLYCRLRQRRGHAKAVGAVARHLAEATYHVQSRREAYVDPALGRVKKA